MRVIPTVSGEVNRIKPLNAAYEARPVARGGAVSPGVLLALAGLCLPQVGQANTGIGFAGVYLEIAWVMLLPVMLLEGLVVVGMLGVSPGRAADLVVPANLTSAAIGLVAAVVLSGVFAGGWPDLVVVWLVFWLSSVVIEGLVVRARLKALMPQGEPLAERARTFLAVFAGNTLSYVAILVAGDLPGRLTRALAHWAHTRGL